MQLAANDSPQLVDLLESGEADVARIKLSRWDTIEAEIKISARLGRPGLVHVLPSAGDRPETLDAIPWQQINRYLRQTGSPHVALHLSAPPQAWDGAPTDDQVIERMLAVTNVWRDRMDVPLLIENVPFYGFRGTLRCATDPEVIGRICTTLGVGLLLDTAHARVAAWHRRVDVRQYLAGFPLRLAREVHVCGPGLDPDEGLRDRHLEMTSEDYELLIWVLERTAPEFVSLEYGGTGPKFERRSDREALRRQLVRLAQVCGVSPAR